MLRIKFTWGLSGPMFSPFALVTLPSPGSFLHTPATLGPLGVIWKAGGFSQHWVEGYAGQADSAFPHRRGRHRPGILSLSAPYPLLRPHQLLSHRQPRGPLCGSGHAAADSHGELGVGAAAWMYEMGSYSTRWVRLSPFPLEHPERVSLHLLPLLFWILREPHLSASVYLQV